MSGPSIPAELGTDAPGGPDPAGGAPRDAGANAELSARMSASLRWTGPGRIAGRGLQLVYQILLGRALGTVGFGLYSLGFTIVDVLKQFSLLGLQNGVMRFGPVHLEDGDWSSLRRCFAISHAAVLGSGVIVAIALFAGAATVAGSWLGEPSLVRPLQLFAIALPLYAWMILAQYWAWALKRVDLDVLLMDLLQPAVAILAVSVALGLGLGLPVMVAAWAGSCAVTAGTSWVVFRRILAAFPAADPKEYPVRELFRVSLPILFVGFSYILMGHVDKLMIAHFRGPAAVGLYTAAFRLSRQLGIIQGAMAPVFAPLVSALAHKKSDREMKHVYQLVTRWILLVSLPIVLVSVFVGDWLLRLFGREFQGAWGILIVLLAGQVLNLAGGVAMQFLQMTGEQDRDLRIILAGLGANIVLNLVMITRWGAMGAAGATAIAFGAISLSRVVAVGRRFGIWPLSRPCVKPVIAALVAAAFGAAVRTSMPDGYSWALGLAVALVMIYVGMLAVLGPPREDLQVFGLLRKRTGKSR